MTIIAGIIAPGGYLTGNIVDPGPFSAAANE